MGQGYSSRLVSDSVKPCSLQHHDGTSDNRSKLRMRSPPCSCCIPGCGFLWAVHLYDGLRAFFNPASVSYGPCSRSRVDVHEYYYGHTDTKGSEPFLKK